MRRIMPSMGGTRKVADILSSFTRMKSELTDLVQANGAAVEAAESEISRQKIKQEEARAEIAAAQNAISKITEITGA